MKLHSIPFVWTAVLVGFAVVPAAGCYQGIDGLTGSDSRSAAIPGRWKLAADLAAISKSVHVQLNDAPLGPHKAANCSGSFTPGAEALRDFMLEEFSEVSQIQGYNCRSIASNIPTAPTSIHGLGRALDIFIPTISGDADNGKGDVVARWLIEHAPQIGIQRIIWDQSYWEGRGAAETWAYDGAHPHLDHLHVELNDDGAAMLTPWFEELGPMDCVTGSFFGTPVVEAGELTVRGTVAAASGLRKYSLVIGSGSTIHSFEFPDTAQKEGSFDLRVPISDLAPGTYELGLWVKDTHLCTGGAPVDTASFQIACRPESYAKCSGADVYWYDSCGVRGGKKEDCSAGGPTGALYCMNGDVYGDDEVAGCVAAMCTSELMPTFKQGCGEAGCSEGTCVGCADIDCGTSGYIGDRYCIGSDVYWDYQTVGCASDTCSLSVEAKLYESCGDAICSGGECGGGGGGCSIITSPAVNTWTPEFVPAVNCSCDGNNPHCQTLYQAKVTAITGNTATMSFQKPDGGVPSVPVDFWVVVGPETNPLCTLLNMYESRVDGTWSPQQKPLTIDVPIWLTLAHFEAAPAGERKRLFIITGGSDDPNARRWYQEQSIEFVKVCN